MDKIFKNNKELFYKGILLVLLAPFIISSFFMHLSADDYSIYNRMTKNAINWFDDGVKFYQTWQGSYSANFLFSLFFKTFGLNENIVFIFMVLVTSFLFISLYKLLRIICDYFKIESLYFYYIFLIFLFVGVNTIPYG